MPVLTPIGLDPAHPFPNVLNKSLNFAVELSGKDAFGRNSDRAVVQAPRALPRVIQLPTEIAGCEFGFVFLSSILHAHVGELFPGMEVRGCYQFRVTRNSDLFVDDEENKNLREQLQGELPHRHYGDAVRLEVADNCSPEMTDFLLEQFSLDRDDLFEVRGPVNLVRLMGVPDKVERPDLKFAPFTPGLPRAGQAAGPVPGHQRRRHPAASPVSIVPAGDRLHPPGGGRPERAGDPADGVSHRHRFRVDAPTDFRRPARQGSHRRGRVDGAFR
jgi:polyphosphate kinase